MNYACCLVLRYSYSVSEFTVLETFLLRRWTRKTVTASGLWSFCLYHYLPKYRRPWLLILSCSTSLDVEVPGKLEAIQRTWLLQVHENSKLSGSNCNPGSLFEKLIFARFDVFRAVSMKLQFIYVTMPIVMEPENILLYPYPATGSCRHPLDP